MKKLLLILLLVVAESCHKSGNADDKKTLAMADTIKPKIDVRVNKKYDEKGNIIQFDSSYSSYYILPHMKDSMHIGTDSLYGNFKNWYFNTYDESFNKKMNEIFFTDSLFKYDLFNEDFFRKRFELNMNRFKDMYRQMDSVKNQYFRQTYPGNELKRNE